MDLGNKEKISDIIKKEIKLEDDMLGLYSGLLKHDDFLKKIELEDASLVEEIINILLRDTERHKKTMQDLVNNL
jgi:hypothetical protein